MAVTTQIIRTDVSAPITSARYQPKDNLQRKRTKKWQKLDNFSSLSKVFSKSHNSECHYLGRWGGGRGEFEKEIVHQKFTQLEQWRKNNETLSTEALLLQKYNKGPWRRLRKRRKKLSPPRIQMQSYFLYTPNWLSTQSSRIKNSRSNTHTHILTQTMRE